MSLSCAFRFRLVAFLCAIAFVDSGFSQKVVYALPAAKSAVPKRPTHQVARAAIWNRFEKELGIHAELPEFPSQKPVLWAANRHAASAQDSEARYVLIFEHLLVAQKLLDDPDLAVRKQGFWIASESANFAAAHLPKDRWLLARIYEGFLLPQVSLANTQRSQDPSRERVLEAAVSAFAEAGERDKQIKVLEWLLSLESKPSKASAIDSSGPILTLETNTLDWARGTLASTLFEAPDAKQVDLERALKLLQSIESPDMKGFQHLQTRVQARLDALKP